MNDSTNSLQEGARALAIDSQIEADAFREKMDRFRTQDDPLREPMTELQWANLHAYLNRQR